MSYRTAFKRRRRKEIEAKIIHRVVQCPSWGYPTEGAYYRDASSVDSLLAIRVPFLAINAEDDPVSTYSIKQLL